MKAKYRVKNSLFMGRSTGDFALCVKGKVDALCGRPSFQAGIRLMRGGPSEVGKVALGLFYMKVPKMPKIKSFTTQPFDHSTTFIPGCAHRAWGFVEWTTVARKKVIHLP